MTWLSIFLGGGLGSLCRYALYKMFESEDRSFPLGTLVANILACILLGVLVHWSTKHEASSPFRLFLMVGFCGGFSTFSTFSNESVQLLQKGSYGLAFANMGLSLFLCLGAIYLGLWISKSLFP